MKDRNEMIFAFSRNIELPRPRAHHVTVPLPREIHADDLERAAVKLRLPALVRKKQCVDDRTPVVF